MRTIRVSAATYHAIAAEAMLPFRSTGARQADGTWLVPLEDETYERLQRHRRLGESDDDTIARILRRHRGCRPN